MKLPNTSVLPTRKTAHSNRRSVKGQRNTYMWSAIQYVTGAVALVAYLAAATVFVLRRKLRHEEELIRLAPDSDRALLIMTKWGALDIERGNYTREQKMALARQQLTLRHRQYGWVTLLTAFIAILFAAISAYAIAKKTELVTVEARITEITRIKLELEQRIRALQQGGLQVTQDVSKITGAMSVSDDPEVKKLAEQLEKAINEFTNRYDVRSLPPEGMADYRNAINTLEKVKDNRLSADAIIRLVWPRPPEDLDLHLFVTRPPALTVVSYRQPGDLRAEPWIRLREDIQRHPGVETIEVKRWLGTEYFCVVNNFSRMPRLAGSDAQVTFEHRGQIKTFTCPSDGTGDWWVVFKYQPREDKFEVLNEIREVPLPHMPFSPR